MMQNLDILILKNEKPEKHINLKNAEKWEMFNKLKMHKN
jgi:hypothetical protein